MISPSKRPLLTQDTTTYIYKGETSMPRAEFELAILATKWSKTYAINSVAAGIGDLITLQSYKI
jgi:hypothetical protein